MKFGSSKKRAVKAALGLALATTCYLLLSNCFNYDSERFLFSNSAQGVEGEERQQVVLLAGPHKTSSSSMQANMSHWLVNKDLYPSLSSRWAWPEITNFFSDVGCPLDNPLEPRSVPSDDLLESKIFYAFAESVMGYKNRARCIFRKMDPPQLKNLFSAEFSNRWQQGYNLVIGSEAFDFAISSTGFRLNIGNLIQQMPWHSHRSQHVIGSDDDITVVVSYRAPRVSHLISLWHQCCMYRGMTFYDFITVRPKSKFDQFRSVDSLGLAKAFLDRGLKVVLLDMEGIKKEGYDTSNIVACDVLGADCTPDKQLISHTQVNSAHDLEEKETQVQNVKTHSEEQFGVSPSQLEKIDEVIRQYDCNYVDLVHHEKLTILYNDSIQSVFDECKHLKRKNPYKGRKDMTKRIVEIVQQEGFYLDVESAEE